MSAPYATQSQWVSHPGDQQAPQYHVYNKDIIRSERDERDYRLIRLQNGLQAMLVHDVKADKAAASLDVAVGHLYDPVRYVLTFGPRGVYSLDTSPTCRVWLTFASICCSWYIVFVGELGRC